MLNLFDIIGGVNFTWTTLRHNGPLFADEYKPHKIPLIYDKKEIVLEPAIEECATMYARYLNTDYEKINKFNKNFWNDWKKIIPNDHIIKDFNLCDFSLIRKHLDRQKEYLSNLSKEEKEEIKKKKEEKEEPYSYCLLDGEKVKIGNFKIEPPGIFIGRGNHPKIGKIKPRIYPEDVIINIDKDAPVPEPSIPGRKWKEVIHENNLVWLSSWKDEITDKNKYIFTSFDSVIKSKSDEDKFDLARKLKNKISSIRDQYNKDMMEDDVKLKQLATALYLIDLLALRIGGKKDDKSEADTVGVTSLRVEHISLDKVSKNETDTDTENNIYYTKLDFLGKDSIRYCRKFVIQENVYINLEKFLKNKNKKELLFDKITPTSLNDYLKNFMKGFTAKVLRTFKASQTFQKEINKIKEETVNSQSESEKIKKLMELFNQANTSVALLCNHQKALSKTHKDQIQKIDNQIQEFKKKKRKIKVSKKSKEKISKLKDKIEILKLKKKTKEQMKNVSLSTSKNNYIDPRIIVAFMKKFDIPIEKIFSKTLITRFQWALNVDKEYKF